MKYPFRYTVPRVGDKVFYVQPDGKIVETVIDEVWDFAEEARRAGAYDGEEDNYLIEFWLPLGVSKDPSGLTYGEELFHTRAEAEDALQGE